MQRRALSFQLLRPRRRAAGGPDSGDRQGHRSGRRHPGHGRLCGPPYRDSKPAERHHQRGADRSCLPRPHSVERGHRDGRQPQGPPAGVQIPRQDPVWGKDEVNNGKITFKNVFFKYEDSEKYVLKDVSIDFEPNELTAIVGYSGSGKSTIVSLISRQHEVTSGEILIGGKRLDNFSRESYYSKMAFISSNTYIFNSSIRDNFKFANENVTDEEIIKALKEVKLDSLSNLESGLDTIINEDSTNISGGEKQRLALAINLIREKEIYIFDEATSNIDTYSEEIIMNNIMEIAKKHTVILISHRLANVVKADKIYYLESGKVLESGTHESLMKKNGAYCALYSSQKELEEGYKNNSEVLENA